MDERVMRTARSRIGQSGNGDARPVAQPARRASETLAQEVGASETLALRQSPLEDPGGRAGGPVGPGVLGQFPPVGPEPVEHPQLVNGRGALLLRGGGLEL